MPGSNEKLSVLGFGCMRLASKGKTSLLSTIDKDKASKQIRYAIDNGVNYIDTAYPYHRGLSESFLGTYVLKDGYREKVKIATKLPCYLINKAEKFDEILNKQMKKLQVEYIDYYLLHALDGTSWDKMVNLGIIDWMNKIKKEGKIKKMGFSFHGTHEAFLKIVDGYNWDFTQVQYNIIDENFQAGIKGIEYAASKGLGIIVMEPLRGGALVGKIPKEVKELYDNSSVKKTPAEWALKWIYNNPSVTLVLSGMNEDSHIKENIKIASEVEPNTLTKEELKIIDSVQKKYRELMKVGCTGCKYCMPCPAGIDIPATFKNHNNYYMFGKTGAKLMHLASAGIMTDDGKAHFTSSCIDCGQCEKNCPQSIKIREEFKDVRKNMETPFIKAIAKVARSFMGKKPRKK